jgi:hypothetical protein
LQDNTSALTTWLSTQSSASIDVYDQSKPTLTADFLSQYNVIIIQWLRDVSDAGNNGALWQFTQDEVNALAAWVHAGGGLITLSGYDSDGNEVVPVNTLLSFASMQYNQDRTEGSDYSSCIHAPGVTGWTPTSPIAAHVTEIGVDGGRSISIADAGAAVAIDCTLTDGSICGAHEDIGSGHVFAFTDEWATYTSQWATSFSCQDSGCAGMTAADKYQVPQFWYNVIQYASSAATCFTIHNPIIIPR